MDEMRESTRIVQQALDGMPEGAWIVDDRKVVLPPRHELHTSMESLIHHFKLVTEGYRVPEGEVYVTVESPRGELGCYLVSDGGPKPWRVKFRAPSLRRARGDGDLHERRARRRPDRHRRLARHGHGRGGPMSKATLYDAIQHRGRASTRRAARRCCPHSASRRRSTAAGSRPRRSARWPRRSSSRPRTARRSRASTTCSTSSPSGGTWSRSARTSPARSSGAQQVLEAFERELGVDAGETTRRRRGDAANGRVRRRVRLGHGRLGRPPLPRAGPARGRARDRQGAARCRLGSSCSRTRTSAT